MAPDTSFIYLLACLLGGIALIVLLTTRFKVPAAFALITGCFFVGIGAHLSLIEVVNAMKEGFGSIIKSLGLIILLGTTLGILLEYTGSTSVMASYILKKLGEKRTVWGISITGFVVGLPIFCDSGYIVLSGLNKTLAKRAGISIVIMSVSLATGLYSVHCMVPPHPGSAAAAGIIGADIGKLILIGALIAIPAMIVGNIWARYAGKHIPLPIVEEEIASDARQHQPSVIQSFLPIIIPIALIALKAFITLEATPGNAWLTSLLSVGDPVIALIIGILLTFFCRKSWKKAELGDLLQDSAEKAGGILVIIGAGGAFGAILAAIKIGTHLSQSVALDSLGLFFPFLLTFMLKTAQGSSTVAIITAASIVLPLLPVLGLDSETGKLMCVLAMGAGSMMISHANDAYFWVIAKFSGLDMKTMLRVYTVASILMGVTSFAMVYILSKFIS
ncbi:GntP family gluconate:H+ symporter [Pedobacter africanus]|uniref:GntP family gluconate:H+ symporter n=1 Tax=Pedobacter africanus TaxID=151894 RepID=A0ACC6L0S2_9SPHI|nr:GntP family permease [Pedobacter africanus]MDR6785025.1 GntP family gluconate:H+ symporter [Pedobacter africanus]